MTEKSKTQSLVIREIADVFKKYYKYDYKKMLEILDILVKAVKIFQNHYERHKNDDTKI